MECREKIGLHLLHDFEHHHDFELDWERDFRGL